MRLTPDKAAPTHPFVGEPQHTSPVWSIFVCPNSGAFSGSGGVWGGFSSRSETLSAVGSSVRAPAFPHVPMFVCLFHHGALVQNENRAE